MSKAGKIDLKAMQKLVNKKTGLNVAHDLTEDNPTIVKQWIPTGSRWLDSIICRGKLAGIPVGKFTEIAGLEATGKSYMAAQIAANAQKMGIDVIYVFDGTPPKEKRKVLSERKIITQKAKKEYEKTKSIKSFQQSF